MDYAVPKLTELFGLYFLRAKSFKILNSDMIRYAIWVDRAMVEARRREFQSEQNQQIINSVPTGEKLN